ncbi:branched-chain amino acid ABC transporter permease [Alkalibacter rhizosphaerae]|uniref:Branched-chain amino acid ABC transporter permease n=1 Tax=Alkalibacter rhizosphaerae TaxID=2815577 RepID=A0A974XGE7_9FIRM|nr:branched-chain amino acid ABC transporter permease [Alkalibacter rhizosphaerae]QSX09216.1 branched-chain amino acid ABC transporter permease [Alkalibacter rhizosphaerae]
MGFYLSILTFTFITIIGVTGIFLITGLTGLFSLGQASFMAIGAYTAGILMIKFQVPFVVATILAILVGLLFGLVVGLPTLRLRRDYIALVTFGFGEAVIAILNNLTSITGGAMGLSGIPMKTNFTLALISAIVCIIFARNYKYSKYGRQCMALKSDELAAKAMGIDVKRVKLTTFLVASGLTAYAGVLYGSFTTYVDPSTFGWTRSAEWIIILFFGGLNSLTGAIFSSLALGSLPELLRFASSWRLVIYAVIVLLILNFRPTGIFGEYELNLKTLKKDLLRTNRK